MTARFAKPALIFAAVLLFLFLVMARIPASWAAWAIHKNLPDVWLTAVDGTVWQGRAEVGAIVIGDQVVPLHKVRWDLKPGRLLSLKVCAEVEAEALNQPASATLCRSLGGALMAENLQVSAPMDFISSRFNVSLSGLASVQLETLQLDQQQVKNLQGSLSWRDARWYNGQRWVSLGAFAAQLDAAEGGAVSAHIFDLSGPFTVDLTGRFAMGKEPQVAGTVTASADAPTQIRDALQFVGEPLGDGSFRIAWPPGT